ncbi:unnamed protein product [Phytophthora fragariaefolia]|uniref:Unnamed protein product n=1 Tax=Phytophthora fragariaefolia TaxID=1490495 RepID=A0A9W6XV76_9STRA|nr:unnamed protein product [Phytophthora fragariaefolia]
MPQTTFLDEEDKMLAQQARRIRMPNLLHPNQTLNVPTTTQQDASRGHQCHAHAVPPSVIQHLAARLATTSNPKRAPYLLPRCDVNCGREHRLPTVIPVNEALLTAYDAARAVETIFYSVTRSAVIYPAASPSLNVGELLPSGVSSLIAAIGTLKMIDHQDVFLDVGCGIGNVLAQFALEARVCMSIGIEVRKV